MSTIMDIVNARDPFEKEFHQAVTEVVESAGCKGCYFV